MHLWWLQQTRPVFLCPLQCQLVCKLLQHAHIVIQPCSSLMMLRQTSMCTYVPATVSVATG